MLLYWALDMITTVFEDTNELVNLGYDLPTAGQMVTGYRALKIVSLKTTLRQDIKQLIGLGLDLRE